MRLCLLGRGEPNTLLPCCGGDEHSFVQAALACTQCITSVPAADQAATPVPRTRDAFVLDMIPQLTGCLLLPTDK